MNRLKINFKVFFIVCMVSLNAFADSKLVELAKKVQNSIVLIETFDKNDKAIGTGSGFFINHEGHLATNYHVIKDAYSSKVILKNGTVYKIKGIISKNENSDIAKVLVDTKGDKISFLPLHNLMPSVGEDSK